MDNPQYFSYGLKQVVSNLSFKPYYKWITLNTENPDMFVQAIYRVLNLIING